MDVSSKPAQKFFSSDIRYLEGKLFTFIEALGLSELQDNGAKGTLREIIWTWFDESRPQDEADETGGAIDRLADVLSSQYPEQLKNHEGRVIDTAIYLLLENQLDRTNKEAK